MKKIIIIVIAVVIGVVLFKLGAHSSGIEKTGTVTIAQHTLDTPVKTYRSQSFVTKVPIHLKYLPQVLASVSMGNSGDYAPLPFPVANDKDPSSPYQANYAVYAHADKDYLYINTSMWGNVGEVLPSMTVHYTLLKTR